jgi:DNA-binding response OmpR family regulator
MVEDEKYMAEAVEQVLRKSNYTVDLAFDGEYGLDCALSEIYDFIILDIMLPKLNGLEVLKRLRQGNISTPIILLTARSGTDDKVKGLDYGADDYLPKPFHTDELLARLRALGRRQSQFINDGILKYGEISFDPNTLILACDPKEVKLSLKEAQILELLIKRPTMIFSKEMLIEKIWGYDTDAEENRVEIHMSLLRKKIFSLTSAITIRTIRNAGYTLQKEGEPKDGSH